MADNIFNNPNKRRQTKEELAKYFKPDERPAMAKIKELLGVSQPSRGNSMQPANFKSNQMPWSSLKKEEDNE